MHNFPNSTDTNPELPAHLAPLLQEIECLRKENADLRIALSNTAEHGDLIEAELYETNCKLKAEIAVRVRAESTLNTLLEMLTRQKSDLEIIVQTLMEHGDLLDTQWYEKLHEVVLQAGIDSLTQIPNRRRFDDYFERQWQQMRQERLPLSIIMCDIDAFKSYNDTYGHLAGDACLKQIAEAFCKCLQHPSDLAARYGGEEFIALLPQTDLDKAVIVAQRMQQIIRDLQIPHRSSPVAQTVTVSMGVACTIPDPTLSMSHLLQQADVRLYAAKRQGKDRIVSTTIV
ncbi:MAG: diguanylate cyclase [Spirulinaceae cyanobacterium RM2_2_10]|nr:diguanylate cyclase [Spirulinaceae cyanobacterium SM2_1_0]NJO19005.1 diguanylate cyclase [Spirulinaceae cyanobacterium RM2_2_10]